MTTTFPGSVDTFSIPAAGVPLGGSTPTQRQLAQNQWDAIVALEKFLISGALGRYCLYPGVHSVVGDGSTDDRSAIASADTAAAAAPKALSFGTGSYKIASNLTISSPVMMEPFAKFVIPNGVTLTINGTFTAQALQVFQCTGTGAVVFGPGAVEEGYCEWWGGAIGGTDCLASLTAAVTALPTTRLFGGDYYISNTLNIQQPHRRLVGHSPHWNSDTMPTRLVVESASAAVINVTPAVDPGTTINNFLREVRIEQLDVTRSLAPAPAASGSEASGPVGILLYKTIYTWISRVQASEHQVGICVNGTVQTHLEECFEFRSLTGTGAHTANDVFWGVWLNGDANIGAAGGNASTYLLGNVCSIGGTPSLVQSAGIRLTTSFVDTYIDRCESTALGFGIYATGTRTGTSTAQKLGNVDLHINGCINDQFTGYGIFVKDVADYGAVEIIDCYASPGSGAADAGAAIQVDTSVGTVTITNCQGIMWPHSACFGLFITSSSGVHAQGNKWIGSSRPVALVDSSFCRIVDAIRTPAETPTEAAVYLSGVSTYNYIAPNIMYAGVTFPQGVNLADSNQAHNEINCTMIDPAACASGSANKLVINSVQVTATGIAAAGSGDNVASGVMA